MQILDVRWFCAGHGNVGIVKVLGDHGGVLYYIGQCSGSDADSDMQHIASWGSRFPAGAGEELFSDF
jgi:hypothetical protein